VRFNYKVGQKPVGADMIENVLAKDINGLEPRLTRQGYNAKVLAELLNATPREIKSFLSGQFASGRTQELQSVENGPAAALLVGYVPHHFHAPLETKSTRSIESGAGCALLAALPAAHFERNEAQGI
jgi:hypothetical protein